MNRRKSLQTMAALAVAATPAPAQTQAIQLHVDLEVNPAREKEMLANYRKVFQPAIRKQAGFVDVKLLKLRKAMAGNPGKFNYRLLISFETEAQREKWVASDEHQRAWPTIEGALQGIKYQPWLYDLA